MAFLLAGCGNGPSEKNGGNSWLETADLAAEETPEELYAAALKESTLIIYTNATRTFDTKAAFEAAYPGLTVEVHDIRSTDIINLLNEQMESRRYDMDLVICPDDNSILSSEFVAGGLLHKYIPYDMADVLENNRDIAMLEFLGEGVLVFYNSRHYNEPPISNWRELTEPAYRGKIFSADPLRSFSTNTLMTAMIYHSDEMAQAYYDLYSEVLVIPEGSTAGQVFWQMLFENDVQFTRSADEAIEFVGAPVLDNSNMAIAISSKARFRSIGYNIAPIYDTAPFTGSYAPNCVMMASGAENINAAKLFIRFLLGETSGNGEGYKPFLLDGTWSLREGVESASAVSIGEIDLRALDKAYYAENIGWINEWWTQLQDGYNQN